MHLKRRPFYYFFNLLVPCGLIGFLAVLGFSLPPESGEKLPLGATILFSLIVFLNMISESMPANSDSVPLVGRNYQVIIFKNLNFQNRLLKRIIVPIGTYFNCVMFTIAFSVVSTIVVNVNLRVVNPKQVQGRSRKLFLCWLPRILRMNTHNHIGKQIGRKTRTSTKAKVRDAAGSRCYPVVSYKTRKQQWIFVAVVVDRLCLICSLLFTFVSVTVFLVYAFQK